MGNGPLWNETKRVVGCAMEVLNQLGHGLLEKPYENALVVELSRQDIDFRQQPRFEVEYKGTKVGEYVPDLVVFDQMIVDAKVVDRLGDQEYGQMLNYLRITNMKVGLLLNFRYARLQWKRVIL
ncbi:MAG: GxxExxY protein [Halofilum sp. (in: g-proteobacteria)]|nr:GxxExxY protein [Halofilum sp. (in: g-proteobacteria)]